MACLQTGLEWKNSQSELVEQKSRDFVIKILVNMKSEEYISKICGLYRNLLPGFLHSSSMLQYSSSAHKHCLGFTFWQDHSSFSLGLHECLPGIERQSKLDPQGAINIELKIKKIWKFLANFTILANIFPIATIFARTASWLNTNLFPPDFANCFSFLVGTVSVGITQYWENKYIQSLFFQN